MTDRHSSPTDRWKSRDHVSNPDRVQVGIPMPWLQPGAQLSDEARSALAEATYVGIDFGTSTSVASLVSLDPETGALRAIPIPLRQFDRLGREIEHHLVPTCIAWIDENLLIGAGAAELKTQLIEGQTIWTSFKMLLGVDLGPQYPSTKLPANKGPATIERPRDAARTFFSSLRAGIEEYVHARGLPPNIRYTVTVPASFESNQRNDLLEAITGAGIAPDRCTLLDEPNAAFLSYLIAMEQTSNGSRFIDTLSARPRKVMVFDFGAGTCDISILEVGQNNGLLSSRNLGISRFWALGGDDIDRAIAVQALLPQLCGDQNPESIFGSFKMTKVILPCLKPVAEELKVACCKYAEDRGFNSLEEFRSDRTPRYANTPVSFSVADRLWELREPSLSLSAFATIMEPFLVDPPPSGEADSTAVRSILEPVESALRKVGLAPDDLDMLLFIGGSSENPLVRETVARYVGRFVDCVTPRDLRSHVSTGAAINSFFLHGLGYAPIQPITSEDIYVLTADGGQERVLAAGSPVPSPDINITEFVVERDDQSLIELPFCVSSRDKLLGVVTLEPSAPGGFQPGTKVRVSCKFTSDKLLKVRATVAGSLASTTAILNPLANHELSPTALAMLRAEQALNVATLKGGGRPSASAATLYARTAQEAGEWRKAAEMFEAAEQLAPGTDHATTITYCYAMAKDFKRSAKWAQTAHQRSPSATNAYNLAISFERSGNTTQFERLMEEALRRSPNYTAALAAYGHHLIVKGDPRGIEQVTRACDLLSQELRSGALDPSDYQRLRRCAKTVGRSAVLAQLDSPGTKPEQVDRAYSEEHLVRGTASDLRSRKN